MIAMTWADLRAKQHAARARWLRLQFAACDYNVTELAKRIQYSRQDLYERLAAHGIALPVRAKRVNNKGNESWRWLR